MKIHNITFLIILLNVFSSCAVLDIKKEIQFREISFKLLDSSSVRRPLNASEPHVVINKKNPANIIAGSILDNVYFSIDTGKNWQTLQLKSSYGVYGDPVLISDEQGRIYYFHLASGQREGGHWLEGIVMQYSDNGGKTWSDGVLIGKNGTKQQDKPWPAIDNQSGKLAVAWTEFDRYGSKNREDKSRVLISFSHDRGIGWTKPVQVNDTDGDCLDDDFTPEGAVPVFDKKGRVYLLWAFDNKIWLDVSADGGKTWGKDQVVTIQKAGWSFDIQGIYRTNGLPNAFMDKNGNLHVIFGDQTKENGGDIRWVLSRNEGKTWKEITWPVSVQNDQFFPAVAYDKERDLVFVLFYDRSRTDSEMTEVKLLMANSKGEFQKLLTVSSRPFKPEKKLFFGDYIGIDIHGDILTLVWTEIHQYKTFVKSRTFELK